MLAPGSTPALPDPHPSKQEPWVDYPRKAVTVPVPPAEDGEATLLHGAWYFIKARKRGSYSIEFSGRFDFDAGRTPLGYDRLVGFIIDGDGTVMLDPEDITLFQPLDDPTGD